MWRVLVVLVVLGVGGEALSAEADAASAEQFFREFVELGHGFDPAVADLYADTAVIKTRRRDRHGVEKELETSGADWRALILRAMPLARLTGYKSIFSNVEVSVDGARARIKADRYSARKCYTDRGYYMVIERDADGAYRIVEEYSETRAESEC